MQGWGAYTETFLVGQALRPGRASCCGHSSVCRESPHPRHLWAGVPGHISPREEPVAPLHEGQQRQEQEGGVTFPVSRAGEPWGLLLCAPKSPHSTEFSRALPAEHSEGSPLSWTGQGAQTPRLAGETPPKSGLHPPANPARSCTRSLTSAAGTAAAVAHWSGRSTCILGRGGVGGPSVLPMWAAAWQPHTWTWMVLSPGARWSPLKSQ